MPRILPVFVTLFAVSADFISFIASSTGRTFDSPGDAGRAADRRRGSCRTQRNAR